MPRNDPNAIDVREALRLKRLHGSWTKVAKILKRDNGMCYQAKSIYNAVAKATKTKVLK